MAGDEGAGIAVICPCGAGHSGGRGSCGTFRCGAKRIKVGVGRSAIGTADVLTIGAAVGGAGTSIADIGRSRRGTCFERSGGSGASRGTGATSLESGDAILSAHAIPHNGGTTRTHVHHEVAGKPGFLDALPRTQNIHEAQRLRWVSYAGTAAGRTRISAHSITVITDFPGIDGAVPATPLAVSAADRAPL